MRFGVLGPLAVWTDDGRTVTVPELKMRLLLADLLVHVGGPVAADRLIDDLWGDRPPRDPGAVLRSKVSQLRRVFADAEPVGPTRIVHGAVGYALDTPPTSIDAAAFTALLGAARDAEDLPSRERLLAEALDLWRGPALADLSDHPFTWSAAAGLDEARLAAVEDHLVTQLDLAKHDTVAAATAGLVIEHPLRERLRALHMRALYRAGRQSEALDSYETLRVQLLDERGLRPNPELAALHLAILNQDPQLDAAAVAAVPRRRTNLPTPATGIVGRSTAIDEIRSAFGSARLVTLTGPGGVGKTRLALAVAAQVPETVSDVWFVDLAGAEPAAVAAEVGAVLGLCESPGSDVDSGRWVAEALADRRALLVLDNCEHVVEAVAQLAKELLETTPDVRVLATSREPLRVAGEVVSSVPPLPVPGNDLRAIGRSSAVELFVARAKAAAPGFRLDTDSAPWVAAICTRLDGIPLALELAATKVRTVGVRELAKRLDDRFRILRQGDRTAPARHQTLRAVIDWSWDRLTREEQTVLRRMAASAGGYDVDAAEHVCAGDGIATVEVLGLLASLVDRSLVVLGESPEGPRYRLLETVAAYAAERLDESGELDQVQARHDDHFLALAERAAVGLRGPDQRRWLGRLDAETHNLRRALDGAQRRGRADLAVRMANGLAWYWYLRGRFSEAKRSLARVLTNDASMPAPARAEASVFLAGFTWLLDREIADGDIAAAVGDLDDPPGRARAEWFLAFAYSIVGDPATASGLTEAALGRFRRLGDEWGVAACLSIRAAHRLLVSGDLDAARQDADESLAAFRRLGDEWGQLTALQTLDALAEITGDYAAAEIMAGEQCRIAEQLGLPTELSYGLSRRGRLALLTGDVDAADGLHRQARQIARGQGNRFTEEIAEVGLAFDARDRGDFDRAESYLQRWVDWHETRRNHNGLALYLSELGFLDERRGKVSSALRRHLEGHAAARSSGDARAIARALEGLAGAVSLAGHAREAARLVGAAAALRESVGAPLPRAERGDVDRITTRITQAIGAATLETELRQGAELTPTESSNLVESFDHHPETIPPPRP